jgi:tetratricopeptide (TPR) repeat protein
MRRTLNVKLILGLLVAIALLGGGVHLVHGFQEKRSSGELLRRAEAAEKKGDLETNEKILNRYLVFRPDDAAALAKYGLLLARRDDDAGRRRVQALAILEQALARGLETDRDDALRREALRKAADLAMTLAVPRYKDAEEHLKKLLESSPGDAELERLTGRCLEGEAAASKTTEAVAKNKDARKSYEASIKHDPGQVEGYVRLAALLRSQFKDEATANQLMDDMVARGDTPSRGPKGLAEAHLARARYRRENRLPGADEDVARAVALAPDEADVLLAAAESDIRKNDLDAARKRLARGEGLYPGDVRFYLAQAAVEERAGRFDDGAAVLRRALKALPGNGDVQGRLAELLIEAGRFDDAGEVIKELRKVRGAFQPAVDYLDARVHLGRGDRVEGLARLEKARALMAAVPEFRSTTAQADLLLAQIYGRLGNPNKQLAAYRRVLAADSRSVTARLGEASALLALGRSEDALAAFQKAAPDSPAARLAVAELLIARNARLPEGQRRWEDVDRALDEAAKDAPEAIEVALLRANALAARGQLDMAGALLRAAGEKHPKEVEPWLLRANLAGAQGKPEDVLATLDNARKQLGDRVELRLARVRYWASRGGEAAAKALETMAREAETLSGDDRARVDFALADAFARLSETRRSRTLLARVADQKPDDPGPVLGLFELDLRLGDEAETDAASDVERLRNIEGDDGALWRFARAILLTRRGRKESDTKLYDEARLELAEVAKRRPDWSRVPLLEAEIAELRGSLASATDAYLRAIERGERQPSVLRRAVELLNAQRRTDEADRLVQKLLETAPPAGVVGQLAAEMALRRQNPQQSLELASQAVSPASKNYRDHLWLGQVLLAAGRKVEAGDELRRAVTLGGSAPETWLAYIGYLNQTGPMDRPADLRSLKTEDVIAQARRQLPKEQASLVAAHGYAAAGQSNRAANELQAALNERPDDAGLLVSAATFHMARGEKDKAKELGEKVLDPRAKATADQAASARRVLALLLVTRGGNQAARDALALIDQNLSARGDSPDDQRLKALFLGVRPGGRRDAIRAFEELARRLPPTPEEKLLLAQFYTAGRETSKAHEVLRSAAADQPENPQVIAAYVRNLLSLGRLDEATSNLNKLEALQPKAPETTELRARLLAARGQGAVAAALVESLAASDDTLVGRAAGLLEELKQTAAAEAMYRKYAVDPKQPVRVLALAGFLARQHRTAEALDLCEKAWQTCPPEQVGEALLVVVTVGGGTGEQWRGVERRLEQATRENPKSDTLLFALANAQLHQERYKEAEATFRKLADRSANQGGPLNNLAWLLALQGDRASEALQLVNRAIDIDGAVPDYRDTRALAYLATGQTELAIQDLLEAVAVAPAADKYLHLARAYAIAGRREEARKVLQEAEKAGLEPGSLPSLEKKGYDSLVELLARK